MRVRQATREDAGAIARVMAAVAEEDVLGTEPPVDVEARSRAFDELIEGEGPAGMWVLEDDDGAVVGHVGVESRIRGVLSFGMAILRDARGRGGGRMLLDAVLEHARASGAHKVELEVWPDNGPAIALYATSGFEVEGVRRDHYRRRDGSLRSSLMMARLL